MPERESGPRTLTQMLREWDDEQLVQLLRDRPDLAFPAPRAFSELASRATTKHAVLDALDDLNAVELAVAHAASVLPSPFTLRDVVTWMGADGASDNAAVEAAVERLRRRALVWGSDAALRPVRVLVTALDDEGPTTAGHHAPLTPPDLDEVGRQRSRLVNKAAAGSAFEFLRRVEVLVEHSDHHPVRMTQAGRLAVRDVRALGQLLDIEPAYAQTHLEFAYAAHFVGMSADGLDEVVIPTERFDEWRALDLPDQWRSLADTWLERDLGSGPPAMKALLIAAYGDPAEGRVLAADDLRKWLDWHRPRRARAWARALPAFVSQAQTIGLTGLGALAAFAVDPSAAPLAELLPERVDHVLLQADLTAIAPGPLRPDIAMDFAAFADVESRGGATVFRFTRETLAQAMTLGWTPDDIVETLRKTSRTPVPQPLEYLVRDLERQPPLTTSRAVLAAPGDGRHRSPRRASSPGEAVDLTADDRVDDALAADVVGALRASDVVDEGMTEHGSYSDSLGNAPIDTIREAVETREVVWLGFVDRVGARRERTLRAASVEDGYVTGADAGSGEALMIPLARITAAHIIRSTASR